MALHLRGRLAGEVSQLRAIHAAFLQTVNLEGLGAHKSSGDLQFSDAPGSRQEEASSKNTQPQSQGGELGLDGKVVEAVSDGGALESPSDAPKTAPVKPPEKGKGKPGSFTTPLDLVKQRMWQSGLQAAGPLSTGPAEETALGSTASASGVGRKTDTSASGARLSEGGAKTGSIQYLNVHKERLAELKALEELTFDDVDAWSRKSSEGVEPGVKAMMAGELQQSKLQLISAYHDLQIVPMRKLFAWAIPTEEALEAIKQCSPKGVVEIGAGSGYWAALLEERDVSVRAFDRDPVHERYNGHHSPVTPEQLSALAERIEYPKKLELNLDVEMIRRLGFGWVEEGGPKAAERHPERSLLLCWPPDETDESSPEDVKSMGVEALNAYKGSTLIYVGEPLESKPSSGEKISRTAGPRFERSLKEGGWKLQKEVELPHWPQCGDRLQVWTRDSAEVSSSGNDAEGGNDQKPAGESTSGTEESENGDSAEESVEELKEKLLRLTGSASSAREASAEDGVARGTAGGKKVIFSWNTEHGVSPDVLVDVLKVADTLHKAQLVEARRKGGTMVGEAERQAYMEMLRAAWDAVASDLIARRVYKEWHVRRVHAPLSRIEAETNTRHMARQGFLRRYLMRLGYKIVKDKEDSF
ncbi:hypothetical protein KFL_000360040 [Klebsormidium nitens]|uniref:S-adenosyl-L-methionine-dependent methyltransferases superfamily protein n=1 Tax=Klebsormidium nitens TaxID=105231 RepID=A0A1Y1HV10_KLENI|nr:hypothetical protein KFL_000360040 [Klebsormidium nitens]|eukprot:GAQ79688.1 hypothetical protein KFL_000360040 [Klebsormidium nitens]